MITLQNNGDKSSRGGESTLTIMLWGEKDMSNEQRCYQLRALQPVDMRCSPGVNKRQDHRGEDGKSFPKFLSSAPTGKSKEPTSLF